MGQKLKKFLALVLVFMMVICVSACKGKGNSTNEDHGDPNANTSVPEGDLTLTITKTGNGNEVYAVGVELDPHFLRGNVGRSGVTDGVTWECKADDWENIVLPRIADMGLKRIRVMLLPSWFAPTESAYQLKNYTWDSVDMQSLYQTLTAAQTYEMDVCLVQWGAEGWFKDGNQWVDIPTDPKIFCDLFADVTDYLINDKGYTCIKEVTPFNEPNALYGALGPTKGVEAYIDLCKMLDETFRERNIRQLVKFNLSDDARDASWLSNTLYGLEGIYDIVNSHTYDFRVEDSNEDIVNNHHYAISNYTLEAKAYDAIHIFGEFGTGYTGGSHSASDRLEPSRGLLVSRIALNMLNGGSCGFSYWPLFSQYYGPSSGESIMDMGLWGFADEGYKCRPVYYAYSLLTRFVRKGMKIYPIESLDGNIVAVAVSDGTDWTYLVVNDSTTDSKEISFLNQTKFPENMKKYVYDQNNVPTDNQVIQSVETITANGRVLSDTVAPLTFTVYTTL